MCFVLMVTLLVPSGFCFSSFIVMLPSGLRVSVFFDISQAVLTRLNEMRIVITMPWTVESDHCESLPNLPPLLSPQQFIPLKR